MQWTSVIAIYFLFWVASTFLVLPIGNRTPDETGETLVPGQADSAPGNFSARRKLVMGTALSLVLFGLFYLNYVNGWITYEDLYWPAKLGMKAPIS